MASVKQRTRVIAVVHSHIAGEVDISKSVISLKTAKTTKARGRFTLQLVPHTNYLNKIFPNDVINVYIDPGDGERGFIRTMFGYVDRIQRATTTDERGATKTIFVLQCSDFQKAVDKTHIYFNSFMRTILDERFARTDQGRIRPSFSNQADGSALRNAGLTAFGSPADYVENFLQVLLGFGSQWKLPESYPKDNTQIQNNRNYRIQRAKARLLPLIRNTLVQGIGLAAGSVEQAVSRVINFASESVFAAFDQVFDLDKTESEQVLSQGTQRINRAKRLATSSALETLRFQQLLTDASLPAGIQDLISLDFIENLATDGFNVNSPVWQAQGTLAQFLYGNTNDFVNELIFDLRPVSISLSGEEGGLVAGQYSTMPDDLKINTGGLDNEAFSSPINAVKYVPAVVFREYPYSVVEYMPLNNIIVIPGSNPLEVDAVSGGDIVTEEITLDVFFGPIFAQNPNEAGRHTYEYPQSIASVECGLSEIMKPIKHIDCVVINTQDVKDVNIGRSDDDVFNLFQLTPHDPHIQTQYRSLLSNFSPIVNQASVARDGLRVWEGTTQFANFGNNEQCRVGGQPDSNAVRRNLARWQLLLDHWYQHNPEYLSGTLTLRGMPEIRVGYRLDWEDRGESYYVEEVRHNWTYPGVLTTTVGVARGQRNDPFPAYIPPVFLNSNNEVITESSGDRSFTGRLGKFFEVRDSWASAHALRNTGTVSSGRNQVDEKDNIRKNGAVIFPGTAIFRKGRGERVVLNPFEEGDIE